jgi:hypothetical protein
MGIIERIDVKHCRSQFGVTRAANALVQVTLGFAAANFAV